MNQKLKLSAVLIIFTCLLAGIFSVAYAIVGDINTDNGIADAFLTTSPSAWQRPGSPTNEGALQEAWFVPNAAQNQIGMRIDLTGPLTTPQQLAGIYGANFSCTSGSAFAILYSNQGNAGGEGIQLFKDTFSVWSDAPTTSGELVNGNATVEFEVTQSEVDAKLGSGTYADCIGSTGSQNVYLIVCTDISCNTILGMSSPFSIDRVTRVDVLKLNHKSATPWAAVLSTVLLMAVVGLLFWFKRLKKIR